MLVVKFKFWYNNGDEEDYIRNVDYIPDQILYKGIWWKRTVSALDFDTGEYSKVHYKEVVR